MKNHQDESGKISNHFSYPLTGTQNSLVQRTERFSKASCGTESMDTTSLTFLPIRNCIKFGSMNDLTTKECNIFRKWSELDEFPKLCINILKIIESEVLKQSKRRLIYYNI